MPVSSLNDRRLAAMVEVGAVFSEIKLSVILENWFHMPSLAEASDDPDPPPHPTTQGSEAPASPAPEILRTPAWSSCWRVSLPFSLIFLPRICNYLRHLYWFVTDFTCLQSNEQRASFG